jgi:hypothetical protein
MGSPLSPLLADVFMDDFERNLFENNTIDTRNIFCWYRYVDDIFAIWTGTQRQLDCFLTTLNSLSEKIVFTCEKEKDGKLNYLDITVKKGPILEFSIFRKDTTTDQIIPLQSSHHFSQKLSSFHHMLNRLLKIPLSNDNYEKELHTIKHLATKNGYTEQLVDRMLKKKVTTRAWSLLYSQNVPEDKDKKWKRLPYYGEISQKIANLFPRENIKIAFYNNLNLRTLLSNTKDKTESSDKCGIYKLKCKDCSAVYVGQTGRSFNIRAKEHRRCFVHGNISQSHFSKHLVEEGHESDFTPEILHTARKGFKMDKWEELEIRRHRKEGTIVNDLMFEKPSPLLETALSLRIK